MYNYIVISLAVCVFVFVVGMYVFLRAVVCFVCMWIVVSYEVGLVCCVFVFL